MTRRHKQKPKTQEKTMVLTHERTGRQLKVNRVDLVRIDALEDKARSSVSGGGGWQYFLAVGSFVLLLEPAGLAIAGVTSAALLVNAVKKSLRNGAKAEYIAKSGNFAHLLSESELVRLIKMLGPEPVADQLLEARDSGQKLSPASQRMLSMIDESHVEHNLDDVVEVGVLQSLKEAEPSLVGEHTQLTAVEVAATPVYQTKTSNLQLPGDRAVNTNPMTALEKLLSSPFKGRAFFGGQRTGKTLLAAVATRKANHEMGVAVFHINLCSFTDEDGNNEDSRYWEHATSVRGDLSLASMDEGVTLIMDALKCVQQWFATPNSILVLDEIAYIGSENNAHAAILKHLLTDVADKISTLASSGMKRRQGIWTIAPEFVAGTLTDECKATKKLNLCYATVPPGKTIRWKGTDGNEQAVTFDAGLFDQVKRNYKELTMPPVTADLAGLDRICFVDGSWMPVGIDGDSLDNIPLKQAKSIREPSSVDNDDFDSPVADVLEQQIHIQKNIDEAKAQFEKDPGVLALIDWLSREQDTGTALSFTLFKNCNLFRGISRSREEWSRIIAIALNNGWVSTENGKTYSVVPWCVVWRK